MRRIATLEDVVRGLDALCAVDPRLEAVRRAAGEVPLRLSPPGFASLASIMVSQQVSRASANAIFGRLTGLLDPLTPQAVLAADEAVFREAGLSRPKQRGLLAAARAVADGLDLDHLCSLEAAEAIAASTRGEISVGATADLTAVELDPLETPAEALRTMPVALTLLGGLVTHSALDA